MIKIVFKNKNFVVIDKPTMVLSVPARFADDGRPVAGKILEHELGQKIYPTHRLDYEVSGLLLFALSAPAHAAANSWFEKKEIQKIYQALTEGVTPVQPDFEWRSKLLRGKKRAYESPVGKSAITKAHFIAKQSQGLLWDLAPITGRAHQLRYETSKHQFPILGDLLYGSKLAWGQGIALKAYKIIFPKVGLEKWDLPEKIEIAGLI